MRHVSVIPVSKVNRLRRENVLKSLMKVEVQKPEEFALMRLFACSGKGIIHAAAKAGHEECLEFLRAAIIVEKICKKYPDFKVDLALNTVLEPRGASDTDHTVDEDKIKEIISDKDCVTVADLLPITLLKTYHIKKLMLKLFLPLF